MKRDDGISRRSALIKGSAAAVTVAIPAGFYLRQQADSLSDQIWHTGSEWVYGIAFSPDSHSLYCGTQESLQVWNVATGSNIATTPTSSQVSSVAVSPDGKLLAVAKDDLEIWDSATSKPLRTLAAGAGANVQSVAIAGGTSLVGAGCQDATVRVWSVDGTQVSHVLQGHSASVNGVAFSADGTLLASGSDDGTVKVWSAPTGELLRTLSAGDKVDSVAFAAHGTSLASGAVNGNGTGVARIWDASTGAASAGLTGRGNAMGEVALSPDGRLLASGGDGSRVNIWNLSQRSVARSGSTGASINGLAFSPDGRLLAMGLADGSIGICTSF